MAGAFGKAHFWTPPQGHAQSTDLRFALRGRVNRFAEDGVGGSIQASLKVGCACMARPSSCTVSSARIAATPCRQIPQDAPLALLWQRLALLLSRLLQIFSGSFWRIALEFAPPLVHLPVVKHD